METIYIKQSKSKAIGLSLLSLLMTAMSIFIVVLGLEGPDAFDMGVGAIGSLFFGLCSWVIVSRTLKTLRNVEEDFLLKLEAKGLIDHTSYRSLGLIPWQEMKAVKQKRIMFQTFICIDFVDVDKMYGKSRKLVKGFNKSMNYGDLAININTASVSTGAVVAMIKARIQASTEV